MKQFNRLYYTKSIIAKGTRKLTKLVTSSQLFNYVSLGDSIASGYEIDDNWKNDYGRGSEYGENGNTSTAIVPNTYTDLIQQELKAKYGDNTSIVSFAHSGDAVSHLLEKLDKPEIIAAIEKADLVTICIGANDLLQPALDFLEEGFQEYINTGDLTSLAATMQGNLVRLNTDSDPGSYKALINRLNAINPKGKFIFTTIYNPYKYLWIEEGPSGFFKPVLDSIPQITVLGYEIDVMLKAGLLETDAVEKLFNRTNGIGDWIESYLIQLNNILKDKINSSGDNFVYADAKATFDSVPDRRIEAEKHYNDLVNVEYTRGYTTATMNWGRLWAESDRETFWRNLVEKYINTSGIDLNGLSNELAALIIERVIVPDVDPHPETFGHYAMKCAFDEALGWLTLPHYTISYFPNDQGTGTMPTQEIIGIPGQAPYATINTNAFTPGIIGYNFTGWNTFPSGNGTAYANKQLITITQSMNLYAQWSNLCTITFRNTENSYAHEPEGNTGPQENYAIYINGVEQTDLGYFTNPPRVEKLPYGTQIKVWVKAKYGKASSYVSWNGAQVAGPAVTAEYTFTVTRDLDINFIWTTAGVVIGDTPITDNAESNWRCEINEI